MNWLRTVGDFAFYALDFPSAGGDRLEGASGRIGWSRGEPQ